MHPRISAVSFFAAVTLAACSTDVVAPVKSPQSPSLSVSTAKGARYIVSVNPAAAKSLSDRVAAVGGTLVAFHEGAGIAIVSGLTQDAAARLEAQGIGNLDADFAISINSPRSAIKADVADVKGTIESQADPKKAVLGFFQWNMNLINAPKAWAAGHLGSGDVTLAILDSGIDYNSLDLNGLVDLKRSTSFMDHFVGNEDDKSTKDVDESDPIVPSDDVLTAALGRKSFDDLNGHGTNVATQASSKAIVFAGVTSKTQLMAVKVVGANGLGDFSDILQGVLYAADNGANVANMSLGANFSKAGNGRALSLINRVFNYAKQKSMIIVVAAGNSGIDLQHIGNGFATYCDAPHVICVSAVGPTSGDSDPNEPAFYTNFGRNSADLAAPGGNVGEKPSVWPWSDPDALGDFDTVSWIWSMCAKNALVIKRNADGVHGDIGFLGCTSGFAQIIEVGTSQASPHVAGLAASLLAEHAGSTPQAIKQMIQQSAAVPEGWNPAFGRGRIDVNAAFGQ